MSSKIVARIERELGLPGLAAQLADRLAGSDLQSLMLDVYRRRAERRPAPAVLADYLTNRFVGPSDIDADGTMVNVADGGSVTWTAALLSNRKERLIVGGIGSDIVCRIGGRRSARKE